MESVVRFRFNRELVAYFLNTDPGISPRDKGRILYEASKIYKERGEKVKVIGDNFEASLTATGKYQNRNGKQGYLILMDWFSDRGRSHLELLIARETSPELN